MTAPTIPAIAPIMSEPLGAPIAPPDKAPNTIRAPNCIGAVRLGVEGNWSVTNSTSASTVSIPTVQMEAMKASGVLASGSHPRYAAQLTAAGAVKGVEASDAADQQRQQGN